MVVSVASVGSASGAAAYYANDNYYTAEQSAEHSEWGGDGATRLDLSGKVDAEIFEQVLAGKLLMALAQRKALGCLDKTLGAVGKFFEVHMRLHLRTAPLNKSGGVGCDLYHADPSGIPQR